MWPVHHCLKSSKGNLCGEMDYIGRCIIILMPTFTTHIHSTFCLMTINALLTAAIFFFMNKVRIL